MKATITIDSASGTYTHAKGAWTGAFPIEDLPRWLTFYRRQQELYPSHAATYEPDVTALTEAAGQIAGLRIHASTAG